MANPQVTFETTRGSFRVELFEDESPRVASGFLSMVDEGTFSGMRFRRIVPEFMLEAGHPDEDSDDERDGFQMDPEGDRRGSSEQMQEGTPRPEIEHAEDWALSMSHSGDGTSGPHLFITLAGTPWLDERHVVLGRVIDGIRVVREIGRVEADVQGRPLEDIRLQDVRREA